jgi:hypothetical protein
MKDMTNKTYYDIKLQNSSRIFESHEIEGCNPQQILEAEKAYSMLVEKLKSGEEISEGLLGSLIGGALGATGGVTLMKAIANVLGITSGPLYDLLTSRLILAAVGAKVGGSF